MSRERLLVIVLGLWLLALGFVLQPQHRPPPRVSHATPLDRIPADLPTLPPFTPRP